MNPYLNQEQSGLPYRPNIPPRPGEQYTFPSSGASVLVDAATLQRYKTLELQAASMESKYENQIRELHKKLEENMVLLAEKDSLLESELNDKRRINQELANGQQARIQDHLDWAKEKEKLMELQKGQRDNLDESQQIQKLLAQLKIERDNNIQFSKYLEQLNERCESQAQEHELMQKDLLAQLDDEKKANILLDESLQALKLQMDDICKTTPFPAPQHQIPELQQEIALLQQQIRDSQQRNIDLYQQKSNFHQQATDLKQQNIDLQKQNASLKQQLDRLHLMNVENQKQLEIYKSKDTVIFLANNLPQSIPLKLPKDYPLELYELFVKVGDTKSTGKLDAFQLQTSLSHGPWPPLSLKTLVVLSRFSDGEFVDLNGFKIVFEWVSQCKVVFSKFDTERENETTWGYIILDRIEKYREILNQLNINIHPKAVATIMQRLRLDGISCSWDQLVYSVSILKVWDLEFSKLDLDKDQAITIFQQAFMTIVAKCIP